MDSSKHPHTDLVLAAIRRTVDNHVRNGGVVPAAAEAQRLAITYPASGFSAEAVRRMLSELAATHGLPVDDGNPAPSSRPMSDGAGSLSQA